MLAPAQGRLYSLGALLTLPRVLLCFFPTTTTKKTQVLRPQNQKGKPRKSAQESKQVNVAVYLTSLVYFTFVKLLDLCK